MTLVLSRLPLAAKRRNRSGLRNDTPFIMARIRLVVWPSFLFRDEYAFLDELLEGVPVADARVHIRRYPLRELYLLPSHRLLRRTILFSDLEQGLDIRNFLDR